MPRAAVEKPTVIEPAGDPAPTPAPEPVKDKTGIHDAAPRRKTVDDYPDRPYAEAITEEHREHLKSHGIEVK